MTSMKFLETLNTLSEVAPQSTYVKKMADKGQTKFSQTKLTDPHIVKAIELITKNVVKMYQDKGVKPIPNQKEMEDKIIKHIEDETKKLDEIKAIAPKIYSTLAMNIVESEIFDMMKEVEVEDAPKFSWPIFKEMIDKVTIERPSFFPLRNWVDHKPLTKPRFVKVPNSQKEFSEVTTAGATESGIFIFNIPFMQQLINFAVLKKIKPHGAKYVSNKRSTRDTYATIPDAYAYLEFLVLHEFFHYTMADFHHSKVIVTDRSDHDKIINYAGDFRSNYDLVKEGHSQLPMGLFSDDINLDRMPNYRAMYDAIKDELDKLLAKFPPPPPPPPGPPGGGIPGGGIPGGKGDGKPGDGKPGDGKPGDGKPGGKGDGKPGDGKPGDGPEVNGGPGRSIVDEIHRRLGGLTDDHGVDDPNGKGKGPKGDIDPSEIEDHYKKTKKRSEPITPGEDEPPKITIPKKSNGEPVRGGRGAGSNGRSTFDYSQVQPKIKWKDLLAKFVATETGEEESYSKPHPRSITGANITRQTGAGAIRPGIIKTGVKKVKLCCVIDSSGSMNEAVKKVYANLNNLLKQHAGEIAAEFYLIKFSHNFEVYKCTINGNHGSYVRVDSVDSQKSSTPETGSMSKLFSETIGSSTNFDPPLTSEIMKLVKKSYNVLIVTDNDITGSGNMEEFRSLYRKAKRNIYLLADSHRTYVNILQGMQEIAQNITYIPED